MVPKVSSVYRVDIQKQSHQQVPNGAKKKEPISFQDVLAKALMGPSIGYKK